LKGVVVGGRERMKVGLKFQGRGFDSISKSVRPPLVAFA